MQLYNQCKFNINILWKKILTILTMKPVVK